MVGGRPVNAAAFRTPGKILLRREDVGRNNFFNRRLGMRLKDNVAFQATCKGVAQRPQTAGFNYLA